MEDPSLFILLGLDTLYSIKLKQLLPNEESNEADMQIVFSHRTNKLSDKGKNYPLGMGLYVQGSELHFFGGENIASNNSFNDINFEMGKKPKDESHALFNTFIEYDYSNSVRGKKWINKRMFSFTPVDQPDVVDNSLTLLPISSPIPYHLGYKVRPIVFTISGRVFALATKPYVGSLVEFGQENYQIVFEVFERKRNGKKWSCRRLPSPPLDLYKSILGYPGSGAMSRFVPVLHCVIKNKLFLLADCGEYIFDAIAENWVRNPYEESGINSDIVNLASLEYKSHLLVFLDFNLLAYDLESYGEFEGTFGSYENIRENSILDIRDVVSLSGFSIQACSLCRVDDNHIGIVFITFSKLHVCLFEFIETPCVKVKLEAYRLFHLPRVLDNDTYTLSTFILPGVGEDIVGKSKDSADPSDESVEKSNQDSDSATETQENQSSTGGSNSTDPREENQGPTDPAEESVEKSSQDSDSTTGTQENQSCTGGSNCTVFVKNLPNTITSNGVEKMFDSFKFGKVKPDGVFLNCKHHYAFVEFEDIQSLNKAIKASPIDFGKKKVYIEKVGCAGPSRSSWWLKMKRRNALKGEKQNGSNCS